MGAGRLVTVSEAAGALGVSERTVERLAARHELRLVRIGTRLRRVPLADVENLVARATGDAEWDDEGAAA